MDDGQLPRGKEGGSVINLPSGETFQVPYEGEREGDPSQTEGEIPVRKGSETLVYRIRENRIIDVTGGSKAAEEKAYFDRDPSISNVAEFAFGCNPEAVIWDNVLEDEKVGFHWAYGRSEHLGGVIGPSNFTSSETIVHQDIVYARDSPIQVTSVTLNHTAGQPVQVIHDGDYVVF